MLHDQTFNLDQVAFATKGIKDAEQTISAPKSANKELKGMMKIVNSSDVDSMQDKMMDLSTEILESSGRSYDVANDIDEEELVGGMLDALESDMGAEMESDAIPSYLQPDTETDLDAKLNLLQLQQAMLRQCPTERGSTYIHHLLITEDELGLPAVPQSFYTQLKEYCSQNGKAHTHDNHNVLHIYRTYIMGIWTYIYSSIAFKKDKENPTVTSPSGPTAPPPPPPVEDGGKQTGPSRSPMIPLEIRQPGAEAVVAASPEIPCGRPALVPRLMGLEDLPALTRRELQRALEKCGEDLRTLRRIIEAIRLGEIHAKAVSSSVARADQIGRPGCKERVRRRAAESRLSPRRDIVGSDQGYYSRRIQDHEAIITYGLSLRG
ncbi:Charged multivesicular body protein [Musa troglodytarum]|uniref:Charged multivesicular body protein n=1 Tax=Musa troglodytarum TaxID=320322 RepID=A0A9E7I966_9LILI|nr:Charged multivesicular body protein [Musa troglodytarum]